MMVSNEQFSVGGNAGIIKFRFHLEIDLPRVMTVRCDIGQCRDTGAYAWRPDDNINI
jgi:hypothetical protein